jgi:hypothetical protein
MALVSGWLGDLVHVADGGDAGAEVEELVDTDAGQVVDGAAQVGTVGAHAKADGGVGALQGLGGIPVDLEVVCAAEKVVVDASRRWPVDVDLVRLSQCGWALGYEGPVGSFHTKGPPARTGRSAPPPRTAPTIEVSDPIPQGIPAVVYRQ